MGKRHRKRSNNHKITKSKAVAKTSQATQTTSTMDTQRKDAQQDQENNEPTFNPQKELYRVEDQQYKLFTKLIAFLLALCGLNFIQKSILPEPSTGTLPNTYFIVMSALFILLVIYTKKFFRINQIQKGIASDINNYYTKNGRRRAIKSIFGPRKYENNAVLNHWQQRLKRKGIREGLSNPEIVSEIGSRYASWLGLFATFLGLLFTPATGLTTCAAIAFLFASATFASYTWIYFKASNQHLVNQIIRHETQQH